MPDQPNVSMPMPEQIDNYIKNHEFHWLSKDRKLYTGKTHAAALIENKDLFGFTQKEIDYATDKSMINPEEMKDRALHLAEVAIERGWIMILINKIARVAPGIPLAVFWFFAETPDVYDRLKDYLKSQGIRSGLVRLRTIMMRTWDQPVESLLADTHMSKKGNKLTCQVCGTELGADEMMAKGKCPRCGNPLW